MPERRQRRRPTAEGALYDVLDESWEGPEGESTLNLTVKVLATGEEHNFSWGPGGNPTSEKAHAWLTNWCEAPALFREESTDEPEAETPADPEAEAEAEETAAEEAGEEEGGS